MATTLFRGVCDNDQRTHPDKFEHKVNNLPGVDNIDAGQLCASKRLEALTPMVALAGAPELVTDDRGTYRRSPYLVALQPVEWHPYIIGALRADGDAEWQDWPPTWSASQERLEVKRALAASRLLGWVVAGLLALAAVAAVGVIIFGLTDARWPHCPTDLRGQCVPKIGGGP